MSVIDNRNTKYDLDETYVAESVGTTDTSNATNVFSIVTRVTAVCDIPLIRNSKPSGSRGDPAWQLRAPFNFSIINAAFGLVSALGSRTYVDNVSTTDSMKIRLATLRYFNKLCMTLEPISISQIKSCLKIDVEIDMVAIDKATREQVKLEQMRQIRQPDALKKRYIELKTLKYTAAVERASKQKQLMYDVIQIVNDNTVTLYESSEQHIAGTYADADVCDYDGGAHLVENLLDKCVEPVLVLRDRVQYVLDKSNRSTAITQATELLEIVMRLGKDLGIDWGIVAKRDALAEKALNDLSVDMASGELDMDAMFDSADMVINLQAPLTVVETHARTVKSVARLAAEAAELRTHTLSDAEKKQRDAESNARFAEQQEQKASKGLANAKLLDAHRARKAAQEAADDLVITDNKAARELRVAELAASAPKLVAY